MSSLRLATCQRCDKPFVWRSKPNTLGRFYQRTAPKRCRACEHIYSAEHHRACANRHVQQAVYAAARRDRAVKRFLEKPVDKA